MNYTLITFYVNSIIKLFFFKYFISNYEISYKKEKGLTILDWDSFLSQNAVKCMPVKISIKMFCPPKKYETLPFIHLRLLIDTALSLLNQFSWIRYAIQTRMRPERYCNASMLSTDCENTSPKIRSSLIVLHDLLSAADFSKMFYTFYIAKRTFQTSESDQKRSSPPCFTRFPFFCLSQLLPFYRRNHLWIFIRGH